MARAGYRETPPVPAPRPVQPVLGHARLTTAALETIRRVLDDDPGFRERVAATVTEEEVGRAGWLFLARPEGWQDELGALVTSEAEDAEADRLDRQERTAARRLRGAEDALRRAEETLEELRAQVARAADELARERQVRRAAEDAAAASAADVESLRQRLADAEDELGRLRHAASLPSAAPTPAPDPVTIAVPTVPSGVQEAVEHAVEAVRAVQEALAALAPAEAVSEAPDRESASSVASKPAAEPRAARPPRRRPAALPFAVLDDSPEAADHLVRIPGVLVLVDGYNASLAYRQDLPIPELRRRLVDALDELSARTGADVHVVFDGADVVASDGPTTRAGGRRRSARVRFSPPDVEADDVILAIVDETPASRPVVVASNDRRVQDGARERGANVISSVQLLAALRRER